jgi:hypothetical protein
VKVSYTPPGPVADSFCADRSFISALMGPVGSGKSTAAIMKMMAFAMQQTPHERVRYTRFTCIRNTYPELRSTTIKTFQEWFPEEVAPINWASPITAKLDFWLPDKTRVKTEFWFMALDRPEDVSKLRSLETTGIWLNEASEIAGDTFRKSTERVGRYPPKNKVEADWAGVILDTNPPDTDHWWYQTFEEPNLEDIAMAQAKLLEHGVMKVGQEYQKLFKQPGGLIKVNGQWVENQAAENVKNLRGGHGYYWQQFPNKTEEWRKVFLGGEYGQIMTGKPVYSEYNDGLHCKEVKAYPGLPLLVGFDYGLTPACVVGQITPRGQLRVLADLLGDDMGIRQFARDAVKPFLAMNFPGYKIQATGDPAGNRRADSDEKTCFMELAEAGIPAMPAITNEFLARREAVAGYLTKLIDGEPGLAVSPNAKLVRKGFNGGYHYKRVQVTGTERYRDVPEKNDYSHPHDALQYMALFSKTYHAAQDFGKKIEYPKTGIV